jgi:hypothetical protein
MHRATPLLDARTLAFGVWHRLRYEMQCPLICLERGIHFGIDRPDVLAVNQQRRFLECEVKVDMRDFKRDAGKRKWVFINKKVWAPPAYFWYVVPPVLIPKIKPELPEGAGLMTHTGEWWGDNFPILYVVVKATRNPQSERASAKQLLKMALHQSGTINGLMREIMDAHRDRSNLEERLRDAKLAIEALQKRGVR